MDRGQRRSAQATAPRSFDITVEEERAVGAFLTALRRIRYGSVQVLVQDSRVVQIDTVEKVRLTGEGQQA